MEKFKKLLAILVCIAIIVTFVPKNPVHADALTAGMLGSIAYSIANAAGINFAFTNGVAAGSSQWMEQQMDSYAQSQGMSVVDFFGTDAVLQGATALVVGKYTYDKIAEFLNNMVSNFQLSSDAKDIQPLINGYSSTGKEIDIGGYKPITGNNGQGYYLCKWQAPNGNYVSSGATGPKMDQYTLDHVTVTAQGNQLKATWYFSHNITGGGNDGIIDFVQYDTESKHGKNNGELRSGLSTATTITAGKTMGR